MATSKSFLLPTCVLFISVMQSAKGGQILDIACLSFLSVTLAGVSAPAPKTIIFPSTSISVSL